MEKRKTPTGIEGVYEKRFDVSWRGVGNERYAEWRWVVETAVKQD